MCCEGSACLGWGVGAAEAKIKSEQRERRGTVGRGGVMCVIIGVQLLRCESHETLFALGVCLCVSCVSCVCRSCVGRLHSCRRRERDRLWRTRVCTVV